MTLSKVFNLKALVLFVFLSPHYIIDAKEYNVKYGKFTHVKTNGVVLHRVIGNETWDIKDSPMGDGLFIWARKNSIPVNIKLYTESHEFVVELTPHSTNHTARIVPLGLALPPKPNPVTIIEPTDIEKLKAEARRKIIEQRSTYREKELSLLPNKTSSNDDKPININIVNNSDNDVLAIPVNSENKKILSDSSIINTPKPVEPIVAANIVNEPSPKTVRDLIVSYLDSEGEGFSLIELYGDDYLLDEITNANSIMALNEVYDATEGKVSKVFINRSNKTVRVK